MSRSAELRKSILEILAEGRNYGLGIIERMNGLQGKPVTRFVNIYPELRSMEREGLLKSEEGEPLPQRGNRPRIYYELTDAGKALLAESKS